MDASADIEHLDIEHLNMEGRRFGAQLDMEVVDSERNSTGNALD